MHFQFLSHFLLTVFSNHRDGFGVSKPKYNYWLKSSCRSKKSLTQNKILNETSTWAFNQPPNSAQFLSLICARCFLTDWFSLKAGIHYSFCQHFCPDLQSERVNASCWKPEPVHRFELTDFKENHIVYDGHRQYFYEYLVIKLHKSPLACSDLGLFFFLTDYPKESHIERMLKVTYKADTGISTVKMTLHLPE